MSGFIETAITGKLIAGATGLVVAAGAVTSVGIVHHQHQVDASRVNTELSQIHQSKTMMDSAKSDDKKVQKLQQLENNYKDYLKNNKKRDSQVVMNYKNAIQNGKNYFVRRTESVIKSNQVKDVNKADKKTLQAKLTTLNQEQAFVSAHRHVIYSNKNYRLFNSEISGIVKTYNKKLSAVADKDKNKDKQDQKSKESSLSMAQSSSETQASANQTAQSSSQPTAQGNNTNATQGQSSVNHSTQATGATGTQGGTTAQSTQHYSGSTGTGSTYRAPTQSSTRSYSQPSQPQRSTTPAQSQSNNGDGLVSDKNFNGYVENPSGDITGKVYQDGHHGTTTEVNGTGGNVGYNY